MENYLKTKTTNIAYNKVEGNQEYGMIFLGGFMSDKEGSKATALEKHAKDNNLDFIRFDYFGHGKSSGEFINGTISIWLENAIDILNLTNKKQIIIGSSMGGWIMLLLAILKPNKIHSIIGIASAPDFTENLIWEQLDPNAQKEIMENNIYNLDSEYNCQPYPITKDLIIDGRKNLILNKKIEINKKTTLLHGMKDDDVPFELSIEIAKKITSQDVDLRLLKQSDHRMSSEEDIKILYEIIDKHLQI